MFYHARAALCTFYEDWFKIPISIYLYLPLPACMQLIHGITMLSRWAKLLGPGRSAPLQVLPPQRPLFDPSSRIPQGSAAYGVGLAPPPDFSSTPTVSQPNTPHNPSQIPSSDNHVRLLADPSLSKAITALRAKLMAQPDLTLDIIGILGQIHDNFEQVNQETSKGGDGVWKSTIWDLGAKKVLITRAKLERWAEFIASGGSINATSNQARPGYSDGAGQDYDLGTSDAMEGIRLTHGASFATPSQQLESASLSQGQPYSASSTCVPESEGWQTNSGWSKDLFDQIDPSLWFDDIGDWGIVGMDTTGNPSKY